MLKLTRIVFVFLFVIVSNVFMSAQDAEDQAAQMQVWTEYMTPGCTKC